MNFRLSFEKKLIVGMIEMGAFKKVFDVQFIARNPLNGLNNQISQGQFASMVTRLLFEKFIERRRISTETNGHLSGGIVVNETRVRFNESGFGEL